MPTYKTPDVYVEELSIFPPSVAEVETAIPAFIGYTARATKITNGDLLLAPTRVKSLLEYETYFGGAPMIDVTNVTLDENNNFVTASFNNSYYLYDSLRAFFDNGGGPCYIVSVGAYGATVAKDDFLDGLAEIKKFDEPTMLLFPDAAGLSATDLGAVQQQALMQCGDLKDRVAVLDTRKDDPLGAAFRNNIGINNLKYGAVYSPWLKVNYNKNTSYADIRSAIVKGATPVTLDTLTSDAGIRATIQNLENAVADVAVLNSKLSTFLGVSPSVSAKFSSLMTAYQSAKTPANMQAINSFLFNVAGLVDDLLNVSTGVHGAEYRTQIENSITNAFRPAFSELIANEKELAAAYVTATPGSYTVQWSIDPDPDVAQWNNLFDTNSPAASVTPALAVAATQAERGDVFVPNINRNFAVINGQFNALREAASNYANLYEQALYDIYPVYKNIVQGLDASLAAIPPSGAVAGVYAMVDNQRGVWKAPANVSLSNVIAPLYNFDADDTDGLNVDANAGKSVNAIRAFAGKGTLIWGARTLAGNDNEWRYISVRRFFNMVEESVKKSTYWAVFEPNDANTWVKVRGMIENYLTQKWREGALAGATTKEAFFVRCGLGTTMTSQDVLEGRMNVEIGMAVVRPAEFIVLKFSHKLQTS